MPKVEFFLVVELEGGKTKRRPYSSLEFEKHVPEQVDTLRGQAVEMLGHATPEDRVDVIAVIERLNGQDEAAYTLEDPGKYPE